MYIAILLLVAGIFFSVVAILFSVIAIAKRKKNNKN